MNKTYKTIIQLTDFGTYVIKIILPLPAAIQSKAVCAETFSVYVERRDKNTGEVVSLRKSWTSEEVAPSKGYCTVKNAYACDLNGTPVDSGDSAALELQYGPSYPLTSTVAHFLHNTFIFNDFTITQLQPIQAADSVLTGLTFDRFVGNPFPRINGWVHGTSSFPELPLQYGFYTPSTGGGKRPLILWLHGAGEGGSDPAIAYSGNKVVNLAGAEIQSYFGGAYVLAPQVPTMWMDDGSGQYTRNSLSKYTRALKALIDEFIQLRSDLDTDRVYIGGCSNGGFMTVRMIVDYPEMFAAAYPVCEAFYDENLKDTDIVRLKDLPIWFTHAKNDTIVPPEVTVVPTYRRLLAAGAPNVHFSYFDNVVDRSGQFDDADGKPYEYFGHASWIYMLNDECKLDYDGTPVKAGDKEVTLLQWLALQSRSSL